jgi:hypothetical protein
MAGRREILELIAVLKARLRPACPMCSSNSWSTFGIPAPEGRPLGASDVYLVKVELIDAESMESRGFSPALPLYCQHCGFVASHLVEVLQGPGRPSIQSSGPTLSLDPKNVSTTLTGPRPSKA